MKNEAFVKDIFVLINDPSLIVKSKAYLEQKGYRVSCFASVGGVIQNLKHRKPHVILLSWNLRNTDIVRVYTIFTRTFNFLSIVFSEDAAPRIISALTKSRIPNTILPPLSGPGFHRRIETLYQAHSEKLKQKTLRQDDLHKTESKLETYKPEAQYVQEFETFHDVSTPEEILAPKETLVNEFIPESTQAPETAQFFDTLEFADIPTETPQDFSNSDEGLNSSEPLRTQKDIVQCARLAFKAWVSTFRGSFANVPSQARKLSALSISDSKFKGYLVLVHPEVDALIVQAFFDLFRVETSGLGEKILIPENPFSVETPFEKFEAICQSKACENMSGDIDGIVVSASFLETEELPLTHDKTQVQNAHYCAFEQSPWIKEGSVLLFDLYLNFPKNQKVLLYLKKGTTITRRFVEKFSMFQVKDVWVSAEQKEKFYAYCFDNIISKNEISGTFSALNTGAG